MKKIAAAVALAVPMAASAVDFEIGVGAAKFTPLADGMWYQEGYPHKLNMRSPAISLGATGEITSWLSWRAAYHYLGNVSSHAKAVPDATDYHDGVGGYNLQTKACNGECGPTRTFVSQGNIHGVALTLEPHVTYKGFRFGIEGGPFLFHANFKATAYNNYDKPNNWIPIEDFNYKRAVEVGYTLGASVSRGQWAVTYQYFHVPTKWAPHPAIWSDVHLVGLRYRF